MGLKRGGLIVFTILLILTSISVYAFTGDDGGYTTLFISSLSFTGDTNQTDFSNQYSAQVRLSWEPTGYGNTTVSTTLIEVYLGYIHVANIDYYPNISDVVAITPIIDSILDNDTYQQAGENVTINATIIDEEIDTVWIRFWQGLSTLWEGLMSQINNLFTITIPTNETWLGEVNYTITANDTWNGETKSTTYNGTFYVDDIMFNITIHNQIMETGAQLNVTGISNATVINLTGHEYEVYFDGALNQTNTINDDNTLNFSIIVPTIKGNYTLKINTTKNGIYEELNTWILVDNIPYITSLELNPQLVYTNTDIRGNWTFNDLDNDDLNITIVEWYVNGIQKYLENTTNRTPYSILDNLNFTKHDNVTIMVTPYDGWIYGTSQNTTIEIMNSIPTTPNITSTTALPAYKTTNITVNGSNSTDADEVDGEVLTYEYKFYLENGTTLKDWSMDKWFDCFTNTNCIKNKYVYIKTRVTDGENYSSESSNASIWINNSIPIITNISMDTTYTNETLNCSIDAYDTDSDSLTYWYQFENETDILQTWSTNNLFDCNAPGCDKFKNMTCYAKVDDSEINSTIQNKTVTILNSPPILSGINITPDIFKNGTTVTINTTDWSDADGDQARLECGNTTNSNNLCTSSYGSSNLSCNFINYWEDDTTHPIYCRLTDSYNYSNEITNQVLTDNTPPEIIRNFPLNNHIENNSFGIRFQYTPTDLHQIVSCSIYINNTLNQTSTTISNNSINTFDIYFNKSKYSWKISCIDLLGNEYETSNWNFTINPIEKFTINPIGQVGVEGVENITTERFVILTLKLIPTSAYCTYSNNGVDWTIWEVCKTTKDWELTSGYGEKTVYVKVNHSGIEEGLITIFNDTITYSETGAGTGTSTPTTFKVYDEGDYTNSNTTLSFTWTDATDAQTTRLGLSMNYTYIFEDTTDGTNTSWSTPQTTRETTINENLSENHTYKLYVKAINPSGKETKAVSNGIIVDLTPPIISVSSNRTMNNWTNDGNILYNWTATDTKSGIKGYSIKIDQNPTTEPDQVIDQIRPNTTKDLGEGNHYMHIISIDNARNPSVTAHYGPFTIDKTPPTLPEIINPSHYSTDGTYNVTWQNATDSLSGINYYNVTIIGEYNNYSQSTSEQYALFEFIDLGNYEAIINVFDNAGNNITTLRSSITPLIITSASPNGSSVTTKEEFIVKVTTNKAAECSDNITNSNFRFTGGNYHETKMKLSSGSKNIEIRCVDEFGYMAKAVISFEVDTNQATGIIINAESSYYETEKPNISITINPEITGLSQKDIILKLNGTKVAEEDYSIEDINKGKYVITLNNLEQGSYEFEVSYDGRTSSEIITINSLKLNLAYESPSISSNEYTHMIYDSSTEHNIGIATDSENPLKDIQTDSIMISTNADSSSYLFITSKKISKNKNTLLKNNEFEKDTNLFGAVEQGQVLRQLIMPSSIIFEGIGLLPKGYHQVILINDGRINNNTIIRIEQI